MNRSLRIPAATVGSMASSSVRNDRHSARVPMCYWAVVEPALFATGPPALSQHPCSATDTHSRVTCTVLRCAHRLVVRRTALAFASLRANVSLRIRAWSLSLPTNTSTDVFANGSFRKFILEFLVGPEERRELPDSKRCRSVCAFELASCVTVQAVVICCV